MTWKVRARSVLNAVAKWRTRRVTNSIRFPHLGWTITIFFKLKLCENCQNLALRWYKTLVLGKHWKATFTSDIELLGQISHKKELSVRPATSTSHQSHSSHVQLQTVLSRWEASDRLQTEIFPRRRFCRKFDGLKVNFGWCSVLGSHTFMPTSRARKKQTAVSHSSELKSWNIRNHLETVTVYFRTRDYSGCDLHYASSKTTKLY